MSKFHDSSDLGCRGFLSDLSLADLRIPENEFAVTAPTKPIFEKQPGEKPNEEIHFYSIELGGNSGVMFAISDFHGKPTLPVRYILQSARHRGLTKTNSNLVSEKDIVLDGYQGLEFEAEGQRYHMRGRIYFVDGRLMQMMSVGPNGKPLSELTDRIFGSFRLLKRTRRPS